jgi:hypothetical protein
MTSRDELLRLAERLEAAAGGNECSLWAEAATVLREMLEQKPVAYVRRLDEPSPHCITDMKYRAWKDAEDGVQYQQLYAFPVAAPATWKFDKTYCSQCGGEFGPGNHGYSHCAGHAPAQVQAIADGADLYAAPVPAVDLEATPTADELKELAMQYARTKNPEDWDRFAEKAHAVGAAFAAHLDKLGGKND